MYIEWRLLVRSVLHVAYLPEQGTTCSRGTEKETRRSRESKEKNGRRKKSKTKICGRT